MTDPLTLRDLDAIGVDRIKGVGEKKRESLHEVGVDTVLDLLGDRTGRIVPVYPQSEKAALMTWEIAGWVEDALRKCAPRGIADPVPESVRRRYGLIARGAAFQSIHAPET